MPDKLHDECGVFGIFDRNNLTLSPLVYYGLFALQHRGQESCGIAINDDGIIHCHKAMGLVSEVFKPETLNKLPGTIAIGHVRYSTTGGSYLENAQPLVTQYVKGTLSIAHNGNLTNTVKLRAALEEEAPFFRRRSIRKLSPISSQRSASRRIPSRKPSRRPCRLLRARMRCLS